MSCELCVQYVIVLQSSCRLSMMIKKKELNRTAVTYFIYASTPPTITKKTKTHKISQLFLFLLIYLFIFFAQTKNIMLPYGCKTIGVRYAVAVSHSISYFVFCFLHFSFQFAYCISVAKSFFVLLLHY